MDDLDTFAAYLKGQDRAELTVKGYQGDMKHFIRWFEQTNGESFTIKSVTPTDIREYRRFSLGTEHRKASTVNRRLAALSVFMGWAKQTGLIVHDPTQDIRPVPQIKSGPKYLVKKQQYALQKAIEKDVQISRIRYPKRWRVRQRDATLVFFLLHTGLRIQEMLDLQLADLEIGERKGKMIVRQGKGGKQRVIPLNSDACKTLQGWLVIRPETESLFVWVAVESEANEALSSRSVQRVVLRIGRDAGLERLTPHVLRHTFGKNLIDSGVGIEKVAALLGHANLNTTRIYITPNQSDLEKAVDQLSINN